MLNSATMLLKMRDAVARLMEKCEKITKKMASLVEDLTEGDSASELTEQPTIIPHHLKIPQIYLCSFYFEIILLLFDPL